MPTPSTWAVVLKDVNGNTLLPKAVLGNIYVSSGASLVKIAGSTAITGGCTWRIRSDFLPASAAYLNTAGGTLHTSNIPQLTTGHMPADVAYYEAGTTVMSSINLPSNLVYTTGGKIDSGVIPNIYVYTTDGKIDSTVIPRLTSDYLPTSVVYTDNTNKIPESYLPSYVDDVQEFKASYASASVLPAASGYAVGDAMFVTALKGLVFKVGTAWDTANVVLAEKGKIYVDLSTDITYRWGGTKLTEISKQLTTADTMTGHLTDTAAVPVCKAVEDRIAAYDTAMSTWVSTNYNSYTYTLPAATTAVLGGIMVATASSRGYDVSATGVLSLRLASNWVSSGTRTAGSSAGIVYADGESLIASGGTMAVQFGSVASTNTTQAVNGSAVYSTILNSISRLMAVELQQRATAVDKLDATTVVSGNFGRIAVLSGVDTRGVGLVLKDSNSAEVDSGGVLALKTDAGAVTSTETKFVPGSAVYTAVDAATTAGTRKAKAVDAASKAVDSTFGQVAIDSTATRGVGLTLVNSGGAVAADGGILRMGVAAGTVGANQSNFVPGSSIYKAFRTSAVRGIGLTYTSGGTVTTSGGTFAIGVAVGTIAANQANFVPGSAIYSAINHYASNWSSGQATGVGTSTYASAGSSAGIAYADGTTLLATGGTMAVQFGTVASTNTTKPVVGSDVWAVSNALNASIAAVSGAVPKLSAGMAVNELALEGGTVSGTVYTGGTVSVLVHDEYIPCSAGTLSSAAYDSMLHSSAATPYAVLQTISSQVFASPLELDGLSCASNGTVLQLNYATTTSRGGMLLNTSIGQTGAVVTSAMTTAQANAAIAASSMYVPNVKATSDFVMSRTSAMATSAFVSTTVSTYCSTGYLNGFISYEVVAD